MALKGKGIVQLYNAKKVGDQWVPTTLVAEEEFTNDIRYARLEQYIQESDFGTYNYNSSSDESRWLQISENWAEGPYHGMVNGNRGIYVERFETAATDTEGSYWTFKYKWDPHSMQFLEELTDISFNDDGAGVYTINSVTTDLSGFVAGDPILVQTASGTNDSRYHIVSVTANSITLDKPLTTEDAATAGTTMLRSSRWWRSLGLYDMTVVNLGNAFEQTSRQILFVTYRLYNYDKVTDSTGYEWSKGLFSDMFKFGSTDYRVWDNSGYPRNQQMLWSSPDNIDPRYHSNYTPYRRDRLSNTTAPTYHSLLDGVYEKRGDWLDLNTEIGELYSSCFIGYNGYFPSAPSPVRKPGQTTVQNTYLKNELSTKPYLDIENIGSSDGVLTVSDSLGWTDEHGMASKYRFKITTGGTEGTAEYKLYKKVWSGTAGDTYTPRQQWLGKSTLPHYNNTVDNPYTRTTLAGESKLMHGQGCLETMGYLYPSTTNNNYPNSGSNDPGEWYVPYFQQYIFPEFISASPKGLVICHTNKAPCVLDATGDVQLPVSDVRQIEHMADGTLFVACARTGLWKITRAALGTPQADNYTVTRVEIPGVESDKSCNGVQIKKDGTIWALVGREMCKSTDAGATWTIYNENSATPFYIPGLTENLRQSQRIICIVVNKHLTDDDQFVIRYGNYPSHYYAGNAFYWWSTAGTDAEVIDPVDGVTVLKAAGVSDYKQDDCGLAYGSGGRLFATQCTYAKRDGEWIFYKGNVYTSGSHTFVYSQYQGNRLTIGGYHASYSTPSQPHPAGWGLQIFYDSANDKEYIITNGANSSSTITDYNPYGRNFDGWYMLHDSEKPFTQSFENWSYPFSPAQGHYAWSVMWYIGGGCMINSANSDPYNYWMISHASGDPLTQGMDCGLWETYGWNGTSWEKDHAGSRPVHTSTETVIDGLTATFGVGNYVADEYYDTYVYDGIIKDNATKFQYYTNVIKLNSYTTEDFSLSQVPAVNENLVTEKMSVGAQVYHGYCSGTTDTGWNFEGGLTTNVGWHEPGAWGWGLNRLGTLVAPQKLDGDFTISFRLARNDCDWDENSMATNLGIYSSAGYAPIPTRFCFREWTSDVDINSFYGDLPWVDGNIPFPETLEFYETNETTTIARVRRLDDYNGITSYMWYTVNKELKGIHSAYHMIAPQYEKTIYDRDIADVITIRRVSGTISYEYNSEVIYTSPVVDNRVLQFYTMHGNENYLQIKDAIVTYNNPTRQVSIGNPAAFTGAFDPNFRKIMTAPNVRNDLNHIELDGVPAVINYDLVPPAPGEVTLLFNSGKLWFNEADAGKSITGSFRYNKILNAKDSVGILNNPEIILVTVAEDTNFWGTGVKFLYNGSIDLPEMIPGESYRFVMEDPSCAGYTLRVSFTPNGTWTTGGVEYLTRTITGTPGNTGAYTQVKVPSNGSIHTYSAEVSGMGNAPVDKASVPAAIYYTVTIANNKLVLDGVEAPELMYTSGAMIVFETEDPSNTGFTIGFSTDLDGMVGGGMVEHVQHVGTPGTAGSFTVLNVDAFSVETPYFYGVEEATGYGNSFGATYDPLWQQVTYIIDGTKTDPLTIINAAPSTDTYSVGANVVVQAATETFTGYSELDFPGNVSTTDYMVTLDRNYPFQADAGGRTLEFWMYPRDDFDTTDTILFDDYYDIYFRPGSNNGTRTGIELYFMDASYFDTVPASTRIPQNQWSHIVIQTDDNPSRSTQMWVNGDRVFNFTAIDSHDSSATRITFGNYARSPVPERAFNGMLSGIRQTWEARYPNEQTIPVPVKPYPRG